MPETPPLARPTATSLPSIPVTPAIPVSPRPAGPPGDGEEPLIPPESQASSRSWPTLDRLGLTQAIAGLILGLIALFTSYDHIALADRTLQIPQQWGLPCIAASVATIFVDAQLASRSRLREANERARDQDSTNRERNLADRERNRAAEARERQAEDIQRQNAALYLLRRSALLSGRVQLDPSASNRERLRLFLTLMMEQPLDAEG